MSVTVTVLGTLSERERLSLSNEFDGSRLNLDHVTSKLCAVEDLYIQARHVLNEGIRTHLVLLIPSFSIRSVYLDNEETRSYDYLNPDLATETNKIRIKSDFYRTNRVQERLRGIFRTLRVSHLFSLYPNITLYYLPDSGTEIISESDLVYYDIDKINDELTTFMPNDNGNQVEFKELYLNGLSSLNSQSLVQTIKDLL